MLDQNSDVVIIQFGINDVAVDVWKDPPATTSRVSIEKYGAVTTFATLADNRRFGLDVETWIKEKRIEQIGIAWFAHYTSGLKTKSGDTADYSRIGEDKDVQIFPFHVGWKMSSETDVLSNVARDYDAGADGIAVWAPNQFVEWQSRKNPYGPRLPIGTP